MPSATTTGAAHLGEAAAAPCVPRTGGPGRSIATGASYGAPGADVNGFGLFAGPSLMPSSAQPSPLFTSPMSGRPNHVPRGIAFA
jgi:hypothetical protein